MFFTRAESEFQRLAFRIYGNVQFAAETAA
jgi:hypothetical protein